MSRTFTLQGVYTILTCYIYFDIVLHMKNICEVCKIEFESVKSAKTCSAKCRVTLSRSGVTHDPNVTLAEPRVTPTFKFYTISKANGLGSKEDEKPKVREAKYWYDVPLGAIPIKQKDWPEMPEYMNGRQYFLWWKNNFETGKGDKPVILNPFPVYENVRVELGGEGSRRWGA